LQVRQWVSLRERGTVPTLSEDECRRRLARTDHFVLGTVHPDRGIDLVPVVAAVDGDVVWIPVDTVKPKSSNRLRRLANVEADPRVSLLAEHYDSDWSQLWWVRAHGRAREAVDSELDSARGALASRYPAYIDPTAIATALVVHIDRWTGWTARPF
jgi:PPOX class probable F420-dependent enzyme